MAETRTTDEQAFLDALRPALSAGDAQQLARVVRAKWDEVGLVAMLDSEDVETRRLAALSLGLVGTTDSQEALVRTLQDEDEQAAQMAEHSLWGVWFRGGKPAATRPFDRAIQLMDAERFEEAIDWLGDAADLDPDFAEVYHQRALCWYFLDEVDRSIADAARCVRLIPTHFGAVASMGHAYVEKDRLIEALRCYRRALQINPRLDELIETARAMSQLDADAPVDPHKAFVSLLHRP